MRPEAMRDLEFLALLVHRGHVPRERAQALAKGVEGGEALDALLLRELGWTPAQLEKLRRTRAGEIPELPGYEILARLGTGGTSNVFKAREAATQRVLALKVLKPEAVRNEATRKSFIAEARMLERLNHPSLVRCYGVARRRRPCASPSERPRRCATWGNAAGCTATSSPGTSCWTGTVASC